MLMNMHVVRNSSTTTEAVAIVIDYYVVVGDAKAERNAKTSRTTEIYTQSVVEQKY
jgi:hypothetical protein